jgi:hypothetical protein
VKPSATLWDRINYSCAYDVLFSILYDVWQEQPAKWTEYFSAQSKYLENLSGGFAKFRGRSASLEVARDSTRRLLAADFPSLFPVGMTLTSIDHLAERIFGPSSFGTETFICPSCRASPIDSRASFSCYHVVVAAFAAMPYLSQWLSERMATTLTYKCPLCSSYLHSTIKLSTAPPFIYFSVCDKNTLYDAAINVQVGPSVHRYSIRGAVYLRANHFTSRLIKPNGSIWYHDGILTGSNCEPDGNLHSLPHNFLNTCNIRGEIGEAVGVLYARID